MAAVGRYDGSLHAGHASTDNQTFRGPFGLLRSTAIVKIECLGVYRAAE